MGAIRAPKFLQQQPQVFAGFNPAFPRPTFAYCASLGSYDLASQQPGTKASGDSVRITKQGTAYKNVAADNSGLDFGTYQAIKRDAFTLIVLANGTSSDGTATLFSQRLGSGNSEQINLLLNADYVTGSRPGGFALVTYSGSGRGTQTTSTSLVDGGFHVFAATIAGASSDPVVWWDGVLQASAATGSTATSRINASQKTRLGNYGDLPTGTTRASSSDILTALVFDGVLPDAMMRALGETLVAPNRVFAAPRRIWVPVGAGASVVTIAGTIGNAVASGPTAAVATNVTIAAGVGNAAAAGATANIAANVTIQGVTGNAVATGLTAGVAANVTVTAAVGNAIAAGATAGVAANVTVQASAGNAVADGQTATIAGNVVVAATAGNGVAAGSLSSVASNVSIAALVGNAAANGSTASVANSTQVAASVGNAVAAGVLASVANGGTVNGQVGNAVAAGLSANVAQNIRIAATAGNSAAAGATATILVGFTIPATVANAVANGRVAGIFSGPAVPAEFDPRYVAKRTARNWSVRK